LDPKKADTRWLLLIDNLARTYGCLPSDVLTRADSFDIMVLDVATAYRQYQNSKENNIPLPDHMVDQDKLEKRLREARGEV
tara:strand:- start:1093 stop:1335 length:243 start_codon:yes stop_codon:yes gene_type:complete